MSNTPKEPKDNDNISPKPPIRIPVVIDLSQSLHVPLANMEKYSISRLLLDKVRNEVRNYYKELEQNINSQIPQFNESSFFEPVLSHYLLEVLSRVHTEFNYYTFNTSYTEDKVSWFIFSSKLSGEKIYITVEDCPGYSISSGDKKLNISVSEERFDLIIKNIFLVDNYLLRVYSKSNWIAIGEFMEEKQKLESENLKLRIKNAELPLPEFQNNNKINFIKRLINAKYSLEKLNIKININTLCKELNEPRQTIVDNMESFGIEIVDGKINY